MNSSCPFRSRQSGFKIGFLSLLIACATPALFGEQILPPLVSTSGTAQVRVVPDLADLSFEVEVRNVDLAAARKDQAERAKKVLAMLRAARIAEGDLQSSQVQIVPFYTDGREATAQVKFYLVSQSISCTLHDVKRIPDVTAEAVAAGVTTVRDVSLRTSQLRKYHDEARAKAIRAAQEKAVALANELGVKVGRPYSITEVQDYSTRMSLNNANAFQIPAPPVNNEPAGDGTTPAFAPGTISIVATINVSFLLE